MLEYRKNIVAYPSITCSVACIRLHALQFSSIVYFLHKYLFQATIRPANVVLIIGILVADIITMLASQVTFEQKSHVADDSSSPQSNKIRKVTLVAQDAAGRNSGTTMVPITSSF
jgi:hypothetical protein